MNNVYGDGGPGGSGAAPPDSIVAAYEFLKRQAGSGR
jgi:hypothetical protein